MGKHDFLTPKAIANRMKSKGLQKLRWYCQLCQKQCRDENGFKCHQMSDSHLRQMEVFGQNPERVVEGYSQLFEQAFMELLRVGHPFSRVAATVVYNEFIANKTHIHMNSTKWYTLTEFVQHLGRTGKCKVDETPKGWFIQLIQEDPAETLARQKRQRAEAHEAAEEERSARELELQMERAKELAAGDGDGAGSAAGPTELRRDESEAPISLSLAGPEPKRPRPAASRGFGDAGGEASASAAAPDMQDVAGPGLAARAAAAGKKSKLQELMEKEQRLKQRQQERGSSTRGGDGSHADAGRGSVNDAALGAWLRPKLVVKVMSPQLKVAGFYKKKGVVLKVVDKFLGHVEMLDGGGEARVDQAQLETVIPKEGGVVMVVRGAHAGWQGRLVRIDVQGFRALVHLLDGRDAGSEEWFEYEDICKLVKN